MEKIKFVMTDTDTQVSAVCSRALEAKGIAVTVCEKNGTKALETLLAVHPQAVLLDAFMPDLDAITVKQRYEAMLEQDPDNARFKMLLDNYGYTVFDLGRDVDPQEVLKTVKKRDIKLVGLSALMTTTVVAMEETIKLLHAEVPDVKIIVGGAVLTPEYAKQIGADYYAKDAAESARIAEEVFGR